MTNMTGLKILGTGSFVPEFRMTNKLLESIVETDDEWIKTRTGISERRIASPEETSLSMSLSAAKKALDSARQSGGISDFSDIGVIVCATITGDYITPSLSCLLQKELDLPQDIAAIDINCACSGYVMALKTAHSLLETMPGRSGLVIGCEMLSRITDYTDRTTCVLFGDAAGAAVIARTDGGAHPFAFDCGSRGNNDFLYCKTQYMGNNPLMPRTAEHIPDGLHMNGQEVFRFAVEVCAKSVNKVLISSGISANDVTKFIFHQANKRIIDAVAKKLAVQPEKCFVNIEKYGNTSSATCAVSLDEVIRGGEVHPGDRIVIAAFGGGLTHAGILFTL